MADLQINVDARTVTGKHTRRLRAAGIVPGVLFGKKAGSVPVQLPLVVRRTWPTRVVPETAGSPVFVGATLGAALEAPGSVAANAAQSAATSAAPPTIIR